MIAKAGIPAVAYYRMSSDKQEASIPAQREAVERYAAEKGYDIIREYLDEGISGDATEKRLQFLRMIRDTASGDFDVVMCWDQDRFGRFDPIEGGYWIKPMRDAGVRLVTVAQGVIDWDDFAGRIVWTINQEAKRAYLSDLSRNVLRGHVQTAMRGEWLGGNPPYGYAVDGKPKKLTLGNPAKVKLVRRLYREYLRGESLRSLADSLNADGIPGPYAEINPNCSGKWSGQGVRSILTNELYTGTFHWNRGTKAQYTRVLNGRPEKTRKGGGYQRNDVEDRIIIEGNHPAIIPPKTFNAVQKRLHARKGQRTPKRNPDFVLTGVLKCGHCGSAMHGDKNGQQYVCNGYKARGLSCCRRYAIGQDRIVNLLVSEIESKLTTPKNIARIRKRMEAICRERTAPGELKELRKQLADIDGRLRRSRKRLLEVDSNMIGEIQDAVRKQRREREATAAMLKDAETPRSELKARREQDIERALQGVHRLRHVIETGSPRLVREMLTTTIDHVDLFFRTEQKGKKHRYFLDHGTIFLPESEVSELANAHGRTSLGGIIAAITSGLALLAGSSIRRETALPKSILRELPTEQFLQGWCVAVSRDDFCDLGGFDEAMSLYWSDTDFQARLLKSHGADHTKLAAVSQLPLRHQSHQTTRHLSDRRRIWRDNRETFIRKWASR